ncbi:MAG TPA: GntG family PLP-dependent aldolase [Gemmatimonadaceae bacterium]
MPIDLRSDTVTRPSAAMRRAMAEAEVGDDERDGDPTVMRLEARVADLLGKEKALFFPSGVMANQAAVWTFADRATEILLDSEAHIVHWELGAAAALSGAQIRPVVASGMVMSADDLRGAFRVPSRYQSAPSLVCVEDTHNGAGGKITDIAELRAIRHVAAEHGLPVHMDGARLWNASVASGISLAEIAETVDTVMVAFSKGLGAPVGAALAGSRGAMERAWTARKLFGGAMRQSGILAAAALYALDHNIERLEEDHEHARLLARQLDGAGGVKVVPPDTNIVMLDLPPGKTVDPIALAAAEEGVLISEWNPTRIRLVTHLDVSKEQVERAANVLRKVMERV